MNKMQPPCGVFFLLKFPSAKEITNYKTPEVEGIVLLKTIHLRTQAWNALAIGNPFKVIPRKEQTL